MSTNKLICDTIEKGNKTLELLNEQKNIINNIEKGINNVESNLKISNSIVTKMLSLPNRIYTYIFSSQKTEIYTEDENSSNYISLVTNNLDDLYKVNKLINEELNVQNQSLCDIENKIVNNTQNVRTVNNNISKLF